MSGNSYKKSSISFFIFGVSSLEPAIAATETNKSFPIFPLFPIFSKTNGLLVISKFCFRGIKGILLLNEIFVLPAGGGGRSPLSIKSSIVGREGGGLSSPYLFKKSIFVPPSGGGGPLLKLLLLLLKLSFLMSLSLWSLFLIQMLCLDDLVKI